ncbi:hypothetical protein HK104_001078, partial [Borealophlyctis nickersoniae]
MDVVKELLHSLFATLPPTSQTHVTLRIFEVYGDLARDLIDPSKDALAIDVDADGGVGVRGLTGRECGSPDEGCEVIRMARRNRVGEGTYNHGDKSTVFCVVELTRFDASGGPGDRFLVTTTSKFTLVDTPGAEKFFEDPNKLIMKDGQYMIKPLIHLFTALRTGSTDQLPSTPLTALLSDHISGNSITTFFVTINPSDPPSLTSNVLGLADGLRRVVTYPVRNDEGVKVLGRKVKARITQLYGASAVNRAGEGVSTDEYDRLKSRFADLLDRFNSLLARKVDLETLLARSEEDRLLCKKAVLDARIEASKEVEGSGTRASEIEKQLEQERKESAEIKSKLAQLESQNESLRNQIRDTQTDNSETLSELSTLRANYSTLNTQYQTSLSRVHETGLELMKVINGKKAIEKELESSRAECERMKKHNEYLKQRAESGEYQGFEANSEVVKLRKEVEEARKENISIKLEMEAKLIKAEREWSDKEKTL